MIPGNAISPTAHVGKFDTLTSEAVLPLISKVRGAVALGDSSQGRLSHIWKARWVTGNIEIFREDNGIVVNSIPAPGALTISLAFDSNMGIVLTWLTNAGAKLYFFNSLTSAYITRDFPNITSCKLCVDDPREFYITQSDVIFAYTLNGSLYWRQQRDRYDIERLVGATNKFLFRVGLNSINRLQFFLSDLPPTSTSASISPNPTPTAP